jgi:hypothetical protein
MTSCNEEKKNFLIGGITRIQQKTFLSAKGEWRNTMDSNRWLLKMEDMMLISGIRSFDPVEIFGRPFFVTSDQLNSLCFKACR